ncbi:3-phosphoshikimate 1-carboxyvinyltransferase [Antarcticibacterium sp. 1MA-6-2]|uniref:3-phosphoshikimate 1-carboxyvinyltransferase n=1 Tax=Antarcticibacterium sp. 1MA-6-2 TaxID=2908210 RepID=UPI001F1A87F7|nr:3-phosphoshikimate 1-carboxyvinyltransferase [Antarcticibacterium sp. 1MA-6-2]UJH92759.1 3-phosphoshikimate 1-carboxyvinyltransferase [Antarcticibacterium sp. 1MA-6-2]
MNLKVSAPKGKLEGNFKITGSKSESNRALILQVLFPSIELGNLSNSDDTQVLRKALKKNNGTVDIHHAGTAMRFLTAYFSVQEGAEVILTGSQRMQERPVQLLVEALRQLGAEIEYVKEEGCPPLKISGKSIKESSVSLKANISSQYISALMLIAPSLPEGLEINLEGPVTSTPYINMTLDMMKFFGIEANFKNQTITVEPKKEVAAKKLEIESDWSSASYFYSLAAISESANIKLSSYRKDSLQGDSEVAAIYRELGVVTEYGEHTVQLTKEGHKRPKKLHLDLKNTPDLAQTIAVTCLALGVECELKGLHTLKIKETDRLQALKNEMEKFGAKVIITNDSLHLKPIENLSSGVTVATYNDHRMAMAFAPLALRIPLEIEDAGVVSKSYPEFWEHLEKLGFTTA